MGRVEHTEDPLETLLRNYDELNSPLITELDEVPSALEFMRYVSQNRPFVVRGGARDWQATRTWNASVLKSILGDEEVNVAVTPKGNADSPLQHEGETIFVKPWEEPQPFSSFLSYITDQELSNSPESEKGEVRYAQTQNDNLRNEYLSLFSDVEKDISWARIALQQDPEAINLWVGNSRSVTALHKDNYENVYVQIIGEKHFVLLPPVAMPCVNEKELKPAGYLRQEQGALDINLEEGDSVPFATWDPDRPEVNATPYSNLVTPVRVNLRPGDMLYLPAIWYHKVSQSCSEEGLCCAVNYWYDMEFSGSFYPLCNFVRSVTLSND
ncbi:phospholipase A2 [Phlyctema vagabunda]|uniref:Phospholipase A2 n=1 Tax=Phlyctema vagabunda TaxID=108571 RepID=A0ABR4PJ79_9HELO